MYRKVTSLLVITLLFSILVIVCEVTTLAYGRALAQRVAGALPRAPSRQAHPVAVFASTVGSPLRPPGREGPVEWGRPAGRTTASRDAARKIDLRQLPILGRLIRRGEYSSSTSPTGTSSTSRGVKGATRAKTSSFLLGSAMLVAALVVARRTRQAWEEAPGKLDAPRRRPPACVRPATDAPQHPVRRFALRILCVWDKTVEWERVRLVPT